METTVKQVTVKDILSIHSKFSLIKRTDFVQEIQGSPEQRFNRVSVYYFFGIPVYRKAFVYA